MLAKRKLSIGYPFLELAGNGNSIGQLEKRIKAGNR